MTRTIIAAMSPRRFADTFTEIMLKVWFEELGEPVEFMASPFDCERHGKVLWFRAMAGEYGPIEVLPPRETQSIEVVELPKLLTYDR